MSMGPEIVAGEVAKQIVQQNWFKTMTFGQFVICVFLGAFLGGGYYTLNVVVPSHLASIQNGYTAIHEANAKAVAAVAEQNAAATKGIAEESAKAVQAVATNNSENVKQMLAHAESSSLRREKESERIEKFLREFVQPKSASDASKAAPSPSPSAPGTSTNGDWGDE